MEKSKVAISTVSWARTAQEHRKLCDAIQVLTKHRMPVVIADGGSGQEFTDFLHSLENLHVRVFKYPNLLLQAKWSLENAANVGKEYVLYTESDKRFFFEKSIEMFIDTAPEESKPGIILASRTLESFLTFPTFQRYTEGVANRICEEIVQINGDYCYGPILIHRSLIRYFQFISRGIGWEFRFFIVGMAHRLGYPISLVNMDLPCQEEHRGRETRAERTYRVEQLNQNISGLLKSIEIPEIQLLDVV